MGMSTSQTTAEPGIVASAANFGSEMEVDLQTDNPLMGTINGYLKTRCTKDAIRTMNGLSGQRSPPGLVFQRAEGPV